MYYLLIFIVLLAVELLYFRLADYFSIIDKPNLRSSHSQITMRGGGIVFPVSVILFFLLHRFTYPWFTIGLVGIAAISFADDIREQSRKLRLGIHLLAVGLLLYQANVFPLAWYWWVFGFVLAVGLINAINFMDGINGITTAYAFTVLITLLIINRQVPAVNENLILFLLIGNAVFAFFNFRQKARCFAGDVGSIGMAFCLLFFTTLLIVQTGSLLLLLLFAVYAVDSGLTMLQRFYKGENIFQPHRQHLYQYLANEQKWPHLLVSLSYMLVQAVVSVGVVFFYNKGLVIQLMYAAAVLVVLTSVYVFAKRQILAKLNLKALV
jgi:UDP-GlcNAc:undecaprenyl-phosphate/decaprenyl-phosphate GlcNAc-1-phosphate transferase